MSSIRSPWESIDQTCWMKKWQWLIGGKQTFGDLTLKCQWLFNIICSCAFTEPFEFNCYTFYFMITSEKNFYCWSFLDYVGEQVLLSLLRNGVGPSGWTAFHGKEKTWLFLTDQKWKWWVVKRAVIIVSEDSLCLFQCTRCFRCW